MTREEFEVQLALGTVNSQRLQTLKIDVKLFSATHRKTQVNSWIHYILKHAIENKGEVFRKDVSGTTGLYDAMRIAEIVGWLRRDFSYLPQADKGEPLLLTSLGTKAFELLERYKYFNRFAELPIEINYDAFMGYYMRGINK